LLGRATIQAQPRIAFGDGTKVNVLNSVAPANVGIEAELDVVVKNISVRDVRIRLEEIERTLSDTSYSVQVCLKAFGGDGACIPTPPGYVSELKTIAPNQTLEQFKILLVHRQKSGTGQVKYRIVSEDLSDTLMLTANFTIEGQSTQWSPRAFHPVHGFSSVGPIPAADVLKLEFTLPPGTKSAVVEVYDLMGRIALRTPAPHGETRMDVNVRNLNPGVYFVHLTADGKTVGVKRFSVKR
jgi:hypothetical protein